MLMCVDIANTDISLALFQDEQVAAHWRLQTEAGRTADEYALQLRVLLAQARVAPGAISGMIIASVVPALTAVWAELGKRLTKQPPLVVGPGVKTGLQIRREAPRQLGADRVANAVAAKATYRCPLCVVDFGSTLTFDVLDSSGAYLGHIIAPGLAMSAAALDRDTAQLPLAALQRPEHLIGRNTSESMQAGLVFGFASLVEGIVQRLQGELGPDLGIIATGHHASLIMQETALPHTLNPWLTLQGLRLIWQMNRGE